jgi:hypothetical protein
MELSKMFGVKRDVDFEVIGYIGRFFLRERSDGTERLLWRLKDNEVYVNADLDILYDIIRKAPAGIIHLPPPLTDEQRTVLTAFNLLGYKYLTTDKGNYKYVYTHKPEKGFNGWHTKEGHCYAIRKDANLPEKSLYSLAALSDTEPYDIGKALGVGE